MMLNQDKDIERSTNYRLYMDITNKGENSKIITQDVFKTIDQASKALNSVWNDISKDYSNAKRGALLTFEPKTQEDGIAYVGQMSGTFTSGKFFIRIITTDSEPEEKTITAQEIQGRYMELIVDGLGEFKFLFKENEPDDETQGKYIVEAFWNPHDYGIVDFIVGCYINDIDSTMESIKENMIYYIEGARVSCESHIKDGTDEEGVYQDILDLWFEQEESEEREVEEEDWDYTSLKLDQEIDPMVIEIISQCSDGINTGDIASSILKKMSNNTIEKLKKLISMTIDEMAIIAKVTYSSIDKKFTIDFTVEVDGHLYGKIVKVGLQEILFHKITYRKNIKDSVINSLLYTLVQKNVEVA